MYEGHRVKVKVSFEVKVNFKGAFECLDTDLLSSMQVYLQSIYIRVAYEGHRVKVKVKFQGQGQFQGSVYSF